ncbi:hypothetical protein IJ670_06445 [bacterium]|nr:hypothetical protein [bacterium]
MPFHYKLQKILEIRIKKKDEQIQVVIKAQEEVNRIELLIIKNLDQIKQTTLEMRSANPMMYEYYDNFIQHLWKKDKEYQEQKQMALIALEREKDILRKCQQEVDVVEKHKENQLEEYKKEEKQKELKEMNEIGSQKAFLNKREREE